MIAKTEDISLLELPELEPYRTLKRPLAHLQKGIFVAEGEKVVARLLASTIRVYSLLMTRQWYNQYKSVIEGHHDPIEIYIGEKKLLDTIVGHELHQAIMGIGKVPKRLTIEELIQRIKEKEQFTTVLLDGIMNAENMGVILRNCACFGVDAVIALPTSCDPYLRRSVRNSMGNIFQLPLVGMENPQSDITLLKENDVYLYAAHPHTQSNDVRNIRFHNRSCIIFGAEGTGISGEILKLCDEYLTIPMKEGVDSLNVASASAVLLWEATQRNREKPL
jgi:tRNA G18 (ribose-2'-O)-methylase SpoU